jgi:hypothetical protein
LSLFPAKTVRQERTLHGYTILTNDLLWWPAFGMFVYETMWQDGNRYPAAT